MVFFSLPRSDPTMAAKKKKKQVWPSPICKKSTMTLPSEVPPPSPLIKNVPSPIHDSGFNETLFYLVSNICLRE